MAKKDWLINGNFISSVECNKDEIIITNGIVSRKFIISPDFACVSIKNLHSEFEFLRAVAPEASVEIDGVKYSVGGIGNQPDLGFIEPEWYKDFTKNAQFNYRSHEVKDSVSCIEWKKVRHCANAEYPPKGKTLSIRFESDIPELFGIAVIVSYEIYDNVPSFGKYITVENNSGKEILLNRFRSEDIRLVEYRGVNEFCGLSQIDCCLDSVENEFDMFAQRTPSRKLIKDEEYTSQVSYLYQTVCRFVSEPAVGPHRRIADGDKFTSYITYDILFDTEERERRMLTLCRFYKMITPWVTENPMYLHVVSNDDEVIKTAIDQCAEVGFEMVILSFGSGVNMEDVSEENIAKFKNLADYAHSKGIELGAYSLLASRSIDADNDVVNEKPIFDHSPCLCSEWGVNYFKNITEFISRTGFDVLEHDGSYPGDTCASEKHIGHECYEDSLYAQLDVIRNFYGWCRGNGIYLNVPDIYFTAGNNKTGMGYREVNWSLPRDLQQVIARKNINDGTYCKLPSMGWMFVPLTQYHGGGAAATIEPLCDHLDHYRIMLYNNILSGVQAAYRGFRIYDTDDTRIMVKDAVALYKKYRDILESPAVHIRRADGRDYDGFIHCNNELETKGFAVFFNPLNIEIIRKIDIPVYYTGLNDTAIISKFDKSENAEKYEISRDYYVTVEVMIPAKDFVWYTVK